MTSVTCTKTRQRGSDNLEDGGRGEGWGERLMKISKGYISAIVLPQRQRESDKTESPVRPRVRVRVRIRIQKVS